MRISVAICTWNRARMLDQTLSTLEQLVVPDGVEWELLVVNNRSTDNTDEVIQKHADRLPLRRIWEPRQGKSNALNTATAAGTGDWILWTDDDVQVDPQWLAEYVAAVRKFPAASFLGGTIDPWFEIDPPPSWVFDAWDQVATAFAARQLGDRVFEMDVKRLPFGANMAVRADVQRRYLYSLKLGRVGPNEVRGEETEILERMVADGLKGYWIPRAKVRHLIPKQRLSLDYIQRFAYGIGVTTVLRDSEADSAQKHRYGKTHLRLKTIFHEAKYKLYRRIAKPSWWMHELFRVNYFRGSLAQVIEQESTASSFRSLKKAA